MAIAPLIVRVTAVGAAALTRTAAALRTIASQVSAAGRAAATRANPAFSRLTAILRAVASAALRAAVVIGGALRRALKAAADAANDLAGKMVKFLLKWGSIILAVGVALAPLVEAFANLIPLVALLGPAVLTAGAAFGALKVGMSGVSDALKAGLEGDTEAYTKALKKLAPAARDAVKELVKFAPTWRKMAKEVQQNLFTGMAASLKTFFAGFMPGLRAILKSSASAIGAFVNKALTFLGSFDARLQFGKIFTGIGEALPDLLDAIGSIGRALLNITEGATPQFVSLSKAIANIADRFQAWTKSIKDSGQLDKWIQKAKDTFGQLKDIVKEVGRILGAIFKGTDEGGFLENLKSSLSELADFLEGESGQAMIEFFSDVAKFAVGLIKTIGDVVRWFQDGINKLRDLAGRGKSEIGAAFGAIGAAASGLFAIISGGVAAFNWIGGVLSRLGGLVSAMRGAASAINAALNSIRTNVVIDIITRRSEVQGLARPIGSSGGGGGAPKFRAAGGPVMRGQPYIVGEKRPELFIPGQSGRIMSSVPSAGAAPIRIVVAPGTGAAGNPWVEGYLQALRNGLIRMTVDRSGRVVPA